jgi:hypothetical protein
MKNWGGQDEEKMIRFVNPDRASPSICHPDGAK